ncbi:MAG TPA: HD family phosphohydrolase [Clostridium sp.]|mgnify:CR=1 FL=1|jgi:uncharacterized protein|uniref:HD family phosphohydrolase n=1 Tax=Clostridium lapidicellarium TaxID=3240931 RepID=A0ABV4DUH1_9CLOT|nr:HD family phosphohydrolase [uncultured Clostridium sp.]NLU07114.1 HD family phosphohydrolase [Clostridiales bacterium]HBC96222.1 HD family phosphohydrolase [Clostridium sp.]
MIRSIKSKLHLKTYSKVDLDIEYRKCINDLIASPVVLSMQNFVQHGSLSCLEHCINVSYKSYVICRYLNLNYRSAARGGLLHDMFLYDWHTSKPENGLHAFVHPILALKNANMYFVLNDVEKDIIAKHMWPLTLKPPKYGESLIVSSVDKYCAFTETLNKGNKDCIKEIEKIYT